MSMLGTRQRAEKFIEYTQKRIDEKKLEPDESAYMQSQISRIQSFIDKLEDRPSHAENKSRRDSPDWRNF